MKLRPVSFILATAILASAWLSLRPGGVRGKMLPPRTGEHIIILKAERKLLFCRGEKLIHSYKVGLGSIPRGAKLEVGDRKTPEGEYYVCSKNPKSSFYLSLGLSYPNAQDAARGLKSKLITQKQYEQIIGAIKLKCRPPWDTPLGGEFFIHGNGSKTDWTLGCIALEDADIKELYRLVPLGTPVNILPQEEKPRRAK
jgi:murein L,D-transpeptidase YafK